MITQARLKQLLDYDPITGWFINRMGRGPAQMGERAGSPSGHGYRKISLDGSKYYEQHLAWLYVYGVWPDELDHRDRDRCFNAIDNLREATRTQNNFNREIATGSSGLKGAYWNDRDQYWYSKIQIGGQVKWLGTHGSSEEAHIAFMAAAQQLHGEFLYAP